MAPFLPYKLKAEKVVKFFIYPESQHGKKLYKIIDNELSKHCCCWIKVTKVSGVLYLPY